MVKDSTDLSLLDFVLESVGGDLVILASHVVKRSDPPLSLLLSESVGQDIKLESLDLLLSVLSLVTLSVDVSRDIIDLSLSLLNGGIKLHGVVSGVSEGLLEVGNLAGELALGRLIFSILLLDLRLVLELNGLLLEYGSLHVLDHLLLLLAKLVVHQLHTMNFLAHGHNLRLTNLGVHFLLHLLLELDLAFPEEDLTLSFHNLSEDVSLLFFELGDLVLKLDALVL